MTDQLRIAVAGCGNIAGPYAETMKPHSNLELVGAMDLLPERAREYAQKYGGKAYESLDEMLADEAIDVVVNLTIHHAHAEVTARCLQAGKHVFSEKPLATSYQDARRVVALAEEKGLRLAGAPITYMGEAQQTAWKAIRDGKLGAVRVAYAEVNWGRIEAWHPNPGPFYEVGALFDVGVYPMTLLTTIFGPARRVVAYGTVVHPDRVTKEGRAFHIDTPDWVVAAVELEDGPVVRLTTNFYVGHHGRQRGLEFHGDLGSLHLSCWQYFAADVEFAGFGEAYEPLPYVREPYPGIEWARGVAEMADAIAQDRPQRATGAQAAHVVETLCAVRTSYTEGRPVEVASDFPRPAPMEWA